MTDERKSHGMALTADTYVAANPETGDRARIVATVAAPSHPEDNPETPDTFDLDSGAGPEEMERRTARAVQVLKDLDEGRGVFACNMQAPARGLAALARLQSAERELHAVRVLDAWLSELGKFAWKVARFRNSYHVRISTGLAHFDFKSCATAAEARIAAADADALAKEDPSLLEGLP